MKRMSILGILVFALMAASMAQGAAAAPAALSPQVALDWNLIAVNAVRAARTTDGVMSGNRPFFQPEGNLYITYVQLAVYDAVVKITHRYQIYHQFSAAAGNASPEAATISAAYNSLVYYLGDPGGTLAAHYAASIAALPADEQTTRGIAVGEASAADIELLRSGDGRNAAISDTCPNSVGAVPGAYLCAGPPPPGQTVPILITPWLGQMQPFMLDSPSQFRVAPPPAVGSAQAMADTDEVHTYGGVISARTPAQTAVALFWTANFINQLQQTLRDFTTQHQMDLVDTVRVLAMGNAVGTDSQIACFDSKYTYMSWRPRTAIQAAGDSSWQPLRPTPNHPEYPSAHGCAVAALGDVFANVLGTSDLDLTIPGLNPGDQTTYATEQQLDTELVNARVWVGFHFRTSVVRGEGLGHAVASWTLQRFFLPLDD